MRVVVGHGRANAHLPVMTRTMSTELTATESMVDSAATGDEVAFARLVAEHHAAMARVAYVICGDPDMTSEVVQVAWGIAWRRLGSLRDPSRIRAWLVAIAANEARQAIRRRRRDRVTDVSVDVAALADGDPADALDVLDLGRVLRGLRPDDRALLAMRFAAGLDSNEIARELGMSASGVRSRLARLIDRLRADLALGREVDR
jgi:RNA polymerase sigma-70 factor, ECF subfamily